MSRSAESEPLAQFSRPPSQPLAAGRHFEDFLAGERFRLGDVVLDRAGIIGFAAAFDPQPFHLEDAAANRSMLGGLSASGWQMACVLNRALSSRLLGGANADRPIEVSALHWRRPLRPDQPLALHATIVDTIPRGNGAHPIGGIVTIRIEACEPSGEVASDATVHVGLDGHGAATIGPARRGTPLMPERPMVTTLSHAGDEGVGATLDPPDAGILCPGVWYEDPTEGTDIVLGTATFSAEGADRFKARHDPYGLTVAGHGDVSGWHVGCVWMRGWVDHIARHSPDGTERPIGPAAGISDVVWPAPAPTDVPVMLFTRLLGRRVSTSRPGWGLHFLENGARLADGTTVMRFRSTLFVKRRNPAAAAAATAPTDQ